MLIDDDDDAVQNKICSGRKKKKRQMKLKMKEQEQEEEINEKMGLC